MVEREAWCGRCVAAAGAAAHAAAVALRVRAAQALSDQARADAGAAQQPRPVGQVRSPAQHSVLTPPSQRRTAFEIPAMPAAAVTTHAVLPGSSIDSSQPSASGRSEDFAYTGAGGIAADGSARIGAVSDPAVCLG